MSDYLDLDKEEAPRKIKLKGVEYIVPPRSVNRIKKFQERAKQIKAAGDNVDPANVCKIVGEILDVDPDIFMDVDIAKLTAIMEFALSVDDSKKKQAK